MTKIKIEIKNRWTGSIMFSYEEEDNTLRDTILHAVKEGADLRGADLSSADLRGAVLRGADLSSADLRGADLSSADLSSAVLRGADLSSADLRGADLRGADLSSADLRGAVLRGADLSSADLRGAVLSSAVLRGAVLRGAVLSSAVLRGAVLRGAVLSSAVLTPIKDDFFAVLIRSLPEIQYLRQNIIEGKINGSTYDGPCSCLSGTLARGAKEHNGPQMEKVIGNIMSCRESSRPIERFFLSINQGDTPETNEFSKLALEWLDEFMGYVNAFRPPIVD